MQENIDLLGRIYRWQSNVGIYKYLVVKKKSNYICIMQGRQSNQYKDPNTFYAPPHPERLKSALKFRPNLEIRVMFD